MSLLQEIHCELFSEKQLKVYVLRLDLIDTVTGGNKYFKMKYNVQQAIEQGHNSLLTFGGAYSNHIAAVSQYGKQMQLKTIGIIRGEELSAESNTTLAAAAANGMHLHFVDRETYRKKTEEQFLLSLKEKFGDFYLVPEGGSNALAVKGCREIINYIDKPFDYIMCACGTGGTIAGISLSLNSNQQAIGIPVLKGARFLETDICDLQQAYINEFENSLGIRLPKLVYDYHFGGYAQKDDKLGEFIRCFNQEYNIELEQVYTGKAFYALFDLIQKDYFLPGRSIIAVHTGGLQVTKKPPF